MFLGSFCSATDYNYKWDANGNLLEDGSGFRREYNGLNQLARIINVSSGITIQEFIHDPLENRIVVKKVFHNNGSLRETVYYFEKEYVRVVNSSGSFDFTFVYHEGHLIAQQNPDGSKYYIHTNQLGSPEAISDENGQIIENITYGPYGKILEGGDTIRYSYTSQEYDPILGDYDYNARRYMANIALFTQPDSKIQDVYDPQSLNHYSYVRNNPYKYIDPTGKDYVEYELHPRIANQLHNVLVIYNDEAGYAMMYSFHPAEGQEYKGAYAITGKSVPGEVEMIATAKSQKELIEFVEQSEGIKLVAKEDTRTKTGLDTDIGGMLYAGLLGEKAKKGDIQFSLRGEGNYYCWKFNDGVMDYMDSLESKSLKRKILKVYDNNILFGSGHAKTDEFRLEWGIGGGGARLQSNVVYNENSGTWVREGSQDDS